MLLGWSPHPDRTLLGCRRRRGRPRTRPDAPGWHPRPPALAPYRTLLGWSGVRSRPAGARRAGSAHLAPAWSTWTRCGRPGSLAPAGRSLRPGGRGPARGVVLVRPGPPALRLAAAPGGSVDLVARDPGPPGGRPCSGVRTRHRAGAWCGRRGAEFGRCVARPAAPVARLDLVDAVRPARLVAAGLVVAVGGGRSPDRAGLESESEGVSLGGQAARLDPVAVRDHRDSAHLWV